MAAPGEPRAKPVDLDTSLDEIRPTYAFQVSFHKSVPQAIRAFPESENFEDAVRKAISLGGESDTLACMAGGIAQAFFGGVPEPITIRVYELLDGQLGDMIRRFLPLPVRMPELTMKPCTFAIGDIHGCSAALDALLEAIRPRPDDCIVTLGDYINRGPDSRGVIERLIGLKHHCRLVPLLGNHEEMLFEALADTYPLGDFLGVGGDATLDSYGPDLVLSLIPDAHRKFLKSCLDFHETESHIFVHASYESDLPMDQQATTILRWEPIGNSAPAPHISGKAVIAGHSSQKDGEILDLGHVKVIDTYCYGGGWLTALDVQTGEVWQADREGNMRWH